MCDTSAVPRSTRVDRLSGGIHDTVAAELLNLAGGAAVIAGNVVPVVAVLPIGQKKGRPTSWAPELRLSFRGAPRVRGAPPGTFLLLLTGPSARPGQCLSASYGQQSIGQDWQVSAGVGVTPASHTPLPQPGLQESPTGGWSWKFPSRMKCETRYATGELGSAVQWISISYASGHSEQVCARQSGCRAVFTGSSIASTSHTSPNAQLPISTD